MRILHVSDLHYSLRQFDWVVGAAPRFDLVVLSGDHLDLASAVPLNAQIEVVSGYLGLLHEAGRVVVSSGNHDLTGPDAHGEQAALWLDAVRESGIPTDGDSLLVDDVLVTVCPWWDGPIGRESLVAQLGADASRRPPPGSGCTTGRRSSRPRRGPGDPSTATPTSGPGSTSSAPTWCSRLNANRPARAVQRERAGTAMRRITSAR